MLRKATHHEPISSYRKGEKEYFSIDLPKMSCLLTGTPNQAIGLIQNSEDGTFSRFLYYTIGSNNKFRDFLKFGKIVFEKYYQENEVIERKFTLTEEQEKNFVQKLNEIQDRLVYEHGESLSQIVRRLGLFLYRIAMILSILDDDCTSTEIKCTDKNFRITIQIGETLIKHLPFVIKIIPQHGTKLRTNKEIAIYKKLPSEFERKEIIDITEKNNVSLRTIDRLLANGNLFEKVNHGKYKKKNHGGNLAI
jgi:hypothetical protein